MGMASLWTPGTPSGPAPAPAPPGQPGTHQFPLVTRGKGELPVPALDMLLTLSVDSVTTIS